MSQNRILVIVVTYNSMRWIDRCLTSVRESSVEADVAVVDNASQDGICAYIEKSYPEVILFRNEANTGFGTANNKAMKYALEQGYDYVYLLNVDASLMKDTLEILIEEQQTHPEFGVISPMQLEANKTHLDSLFAHFIGIEKGYVDASYFGSDQTLFPLRFIMAAHWLISRECLQKVGGFSPSFFMYGEDDNYCDRVRYHGLKVGFSTRAQAVHDREDRPRDKAKRLFVENAHRIVDMSSLSGRHRSLFECLCSCVTSAVKDSSLQPLKYIPGLVCSYPKIRRNRELSRKEGAFV